MTTTAIDLFAGIGGFSSGAQRAGASIAWAGNHWPEAVEWFSANHPGVEVACQDLHQARWSLVPPHDLLLASPACQGHSKARGRDRAHHDEARSTAWAAISAVEHLQPEFLLVENVQEFRGWALYPCWKEALATLGYSLTELLIDAADLGVPQHRVRLFIVGTHSRVPIDLGPLPKLPHVSASTVIRWDEGSWSSLKDSERSRPLAKATRSRLEEGRRVHGDRHLLAYYGGEKGGRSLNKPLGTVRTRACHAVVDHEQQRMRMLTPWDLDSGFFWLFFAALPKSARREKGPGGIDLGHMPRSTEQP